MAFSGSSVERQNTSTRPAAVDDEQLASARRAMAEVARSRGATAAATALNEVLRALARSPSQAIFELVREVAEDETFAQARDERGHTCRAVALSTWLELGYPWALQLTPEALDEARALEPRSPLGWIRATALSAALSGLVYGGSVALGLESMGPRMWLLPFVLLFLHAAGTLVAALSGRSGAALKARRLRLAARLGWLAPLGTLLGWLWDAESLFVTLILFAPLTITALAASVTSARLRSLPPPHTK